MRRYPNVEQVGFIDPKRKILEMAGGFSGNATSCATYVFLNDQFGKTPMNSRSNKSLKAGIYSYCIVWAQMPIPLSTNSIRSLAVNIYQVKMKGITHPVALNKFSLPSPEAAKIIAYNLLRKYNLLDKPKSDVNTLFYETACGSGTTAVGLVKSFITNQSVHVPIRQPSGITLKITIKRTEKKFVAAIFCGPVTTINKGLYVTV